MFVLGRTQNLEMFLVQISGLFCWSVSGKMAKIRMIRVLIVEHYYNSTDEVIKKFKFIAEFNRILF